MRSRSLLWLNLLLYFLPGCGMGWIAKASCLASGGYGVIFQGWQQRAVICSVSSDTPCHGTWLRQKDHHDDGQHLKAWNPARHSDAGDMQVQMLVRIRDRGLSIDVLASVKAATGSSIVCLKWCRVWDNVDERLFTLTVDGTAIPFSKEIPKKSEADTLSSVSLLLCRPV